MSENSSKSPPLLRRAGIIAQYETPGALMHAAEKIRDAGFSQWDTHAPFPIHGMDGAMGMPPTPLGWISFTGGLLGGTIAIVMQYWMNGFDYPLNIAGKAAFAPPAAIPVTFELTVLLTAFATLFGMLGLNRLPTLYHWVFSAKGFERATDDRFFLSIDAADPKFHAEKTRVLLESTHPLTVEVIHEEVEIAGDGGREQLGLVVEALGGISSPFKGDKGSKG